MVVQVSRDEFQRLVCTLEVDGRPAVVTASDAPAAARDLLAAVEDAQSSGLGECLWPEVAGEYRWMLRRHDGGLVVVVLWSSGTLTGWQHVVHTEVPLDSFLRQLEPLRAYVFAGAPVIGRPAELEHAPYFGKYIGLVPEDDVLGVLGRQPEELRALARGVEPARERHRYAPGKWSVREVLGHLIDGERVFGYRALCFSRQEPNGLPGFDENAYVANAIYDAVPLVDLVEEFALVRAANLIVLRRLDADGWMRVGTANQNRISIRALGYVMAGHVRHHIAILASKYELSVSA